jgi:AraC-like DNA-binding protein
VFASLPVALVAFAQTLGLPRDHLLSTAGLGEADLADPDGLVPFEALPRIWRELLRRFPDEPLGVRFAKMIPITSMGVVGYAITKATDFRHAFDLWRRFNRLIDPYLELTVEPDGDRHRIELRHEPEIARMAEPLEAMLGSLFRFAVELNPAADEQPRAEVFFAHPRRHDLAVYADLFDLPPTFDAPFTGARVPSTVFELPVQGADPRVVAYLTRYADALLEQMPPAADDPLDARVRAEIDRRLLSDSVEQQAVAKALGMSVRSLQRGLAAAGTSFSQLLDDVRRVRALALVARADLSVAEIAFALGYTDPRAFYRSFRRWTGVTPTQHRSAL